ncbi:bifunctional adenosylcobinamide kinase/adenosylcobinamide-phosphate guanylyltransferase [Vibrio sp. RC27]
MPITLILGGARSGKSSFAETKAKLDDSKKGSSSLHYVATAVAFDDEMKARIAHHQQRRGSEWQEHLAPVNLSQQLEQFSTKDTILVDCLTVWLNNVIYNDGRDIEELELLEKVEQLVGKLENSDANVILVSNEVGFGVVPMGKATRLFVDHAGWMNQKVASVADNVVLVVAGIPMALKGSL